MSRKKSFIDSGVLIAAARGDHKLSGKAAQILDDPDRDYASSIFIMLEVIPKPFYFKRKVEVETYEEFFKLVSLWAVTSEDLSKHALTIAKKYGLGGMDSLHVAAALSLGADEFITTEELRKPIHRVKDIAVVTIA